MTDWFSVDRVWFTIFDYPMSPIEFVGTVTCLASVWLIARRNMLTWPIGIVSVVLFLCLFYQLRLYSDALEQVYYLGASAYGWWAWSRGGRDEERSIRVRRGTRREILVWAGATAILSVALGAAMSRIHLWFPSLFPEPASLPYLDALTTVMSFTAMWLMVRRHLESWVYWIIVDAIAVGLYGAKGVKFVALLYAILFCLASQGWWRWARSEREERTAVSEPA